MLWIQPAADAMPLKSDEDTVYRKYYVNCHKNALTPFQQVEPRWSGAILSSPTIYLFMRLSSIPYSLLLAAFLPLRLLIIIIIDD